MADIYEANGGEHASPFERNQIYYSCFIIYSPHIVSKCWKRLLNQLGPKQNRHTVIK